jgi:O-antigen/teichoic acid export membrane protein
MASGFGVNVLVMRGLGVEGFGVYGYITTLLGLASFGATLGMDRLLKREMSRDDEAGRPSGHRVAAGVTAVAGLSVVTAIGIIGWMYLMDGRPFAVTAAAVATLSIALQGLAMVPAAWFHAVRRVRLGVPAAIAGRATLVAATAGFLWADLGVVAVFLAQVLDAAVTLGMTAAVYLRTAGRPPLPRADDVRTLVRDAVPFGLNGLFGAIYLSVDVVMLAWIHDEAEVGVYRAATVIIALFPVIAETFSNAVYPRMARHLGRPDAARDELRFATRVLLAISVPAAVGGVLVAEPLLVFIGGAAYAPSAVPFCILAPLLPLRFLNNGFGMTMTALDRQDERTRGVFGAAVFNVALNLLILPRYGAVGAAATTLATEVLLLTWTTWRVRALLGPLGLAPVLARVLAPAAVMGAVVAVLPAVHVLAVIAAGVAVYVAAGRATGAWGRADLGRLRGI